MTCKVCSHHFCWACLAPWASHSSETGGFFHCSRFIAPEPSPDTAATAAVSSGGLWERISAATCKREQEHFRQRYELYSGAAGVRTAISGLARMRALVLLASGGGTTPLPLQIDAGSVGIDRKSKKGPPVGGSSKILQLPPESFFSDWQSAILQGREV